MRNPDPTLAAALDRLLQLAGEAEARRLVAELGRASAAAELERFILRRLAARLLAERAPRQVVRDRLISRGIQWRTAYRVIDEALAQPLPPARCVTEGPVLTSRPAMLEPLQQLHHAMTTNTETLRQQLESLRQQRRGLDLEGARARAAAAAHAYARMKAEVTALRDAGDAAAAGRLELDSNATLATAERETAANLEQLQRTDAKHASEMERLSAMIEGPQRVEAAQRALAAAGETVARARQKAQAAADAVATLSDMMALEEKALEGARASAAAQLLAAVKSGSDASAIPAATRDKLTTLELAKGEAQQELDAAQAALAAAEQHEGEMRKRLSVARAGVTELAYEAAAAAYFEATLAHMTAHAAARLGPWMPEDLRQRAYSAAYQSAGGS